MSSQSSPKRPPVTAFSEEIVLKRAIRQHLNELGFERDDQGTLVLPSTSKASIRKLHLDRRRGLLAKSSKLIQESEKFLSHFASGEDIDPATIEPVLEEVCSKTWQADLFRFASLLWSIPVSSGFGRRMRFLVWDRSNGKLIGLIALTDPVFNLAVRDKWIGWNSEQRKERLVNLMDVFVLGAVPPYNMLLCGKLLACLVRSRELRDCFYRKYNTSIGIISKQNKKADFVAVTTSSALGRSSVYNRLKLDGKWVMQSIGYTKGWGHFHISDELFGQVKNFLRKKGHPSGADYEFGNGPNWRLRAFKAALELIGLDSNLMKHGVRREVFATCVADNALDVLKGESDIACFNHLRAIDEVAEMCLARWVIPRAERTPEYKTWKNSNIGELLTVEGNDCLAAGNKIRRFSS